MPDAQTELLPFANCPQSSGKWPFGLLALISCLSYSVIRAPVPGVNEPHYLTKAKHFWNPEWCAGDLFLESSNPHAVFYTTFGLLTQFFDFATSAYLGRLLSLLVLASGLYTLCRILTDRPSAGVCGLWLLLASLNMQSFSGEWIVGGVESKVVAYGLIFWSFARFFSSRYLSAAACLGGAISLHPVVGMWAALCAIFAWLSGVVAHRLSRKSDLSPALDLSPAVPSWVRRISAAVILVCCSLPGLLPAIGLLGGSSPELVREANTIQVFYRLKHHLDPLSFLPAAYAWYGVLLLTWFVLSRRRPTRNWQQHFFDRFVLGTLIAAAAGVLIGLRSGSHAEMPLADLRTALLKFYPFRLFDVMLPLAVSIGLLNCRVPFLTRVKNESGKDHQSEKTSLANEVLESGNLPGSSSSRDRFIGIATALVFGMALAMPPKDRNSSHMNKAEREAWKNACAWIDANTPSDALFLTPINSWAFKWHAQRAEYVAYKDCPQDAAALVEWGQRWGVLKTWWTVADDYGYSTRELQSFQMTTGITHIIEPSAVPNRRTPLYENESFRVLRVEAELESQ